MVCFCSLIQWLTLLRHATDQYATLGQLTHRKHLIYFSPSNQLTKSNRVRPPLLTTSPSLSLTPNPLVHPTTTTGYMPAAWLAPQPPPSGNANTRWMASSSSKPHHGVSSAILLNFLTSRTSGTAKGPRHHPYPQTTGMSSTNRGKAKAKAKAIEPDPNVVQTLDFDIVYYPYPVCLCPYNVFCSPF